MIQPLPSVEQLARALGAVGHLIAGVRPEQWPAPTPCTDWTVHELVNHLVGMNLVFTALLTDQAPPERGADRLGDDPTSIGASPVVQGGDSRSLRVRPG